MTYYIIFSLADPVDKKSTDFYKNEISLLLKERIVSNRNIMKGIPHKE